MLLSMRFSNLHRHSTHGVVDVLRWKLAFRSGRFPFVRPPVAPVVREMPNDSAQWIGHSSFRVKTPDLEFLVDPVLSDYCAPVRFRSLRRLTPAAIDIDVASRSRAVFVTHNHYDHLDAATIRRLSADTTFVAPRGLGRWFSKISRKNVVELGWWETVETLGLKITCVPAQHFSSRTPWDRDKSLWCGWVIETRGRRLYFAGDTGYCPVFKEIGERFGGMDFSAIPIGAYEPRWLMAPMHVNPEEAVQIHQDVRSKLSVACHWGTFRLTDEPMNEPPERLRAALANLGIQPERFRLLEIGGVVQF